MVADEVENKSPSDLCGLVVGPKEKPLTNSMLIKGLALPNDGEGGELYSR